MSLSTKAKEVRKKMFGKGVKLVYAETDEEAAKQFKILLKLREEYRVHGGVFKKKK